MNRIQLVYSSDNANIANQIDTRLSTADFHFDHNQAKDSDFMTDFFDDLKNGEALALFLISDNFLKSSQCMYNILPVFQELNKAGRLLPVITDGYVADERSGQVHYTVTKFDRVSDVIQYMNYWQEQYLAMRKEKRNLHPDEEASFNEQLKIVRNISTQIGEFLRYLRGIEYISYDALKENHFEAFFTLLGLESKHAVFKKQIDGASC